MWIRDAKFSDVPTLAEFNRTMAWETEQCALDAAVTLCGVRAVLENPTHGFYLVAELDERVVGSALITYEWSDWRNGRFWWLQSVYVLPQYRRRGVFRAIYQVVDARAQRQPDVCGLRLYVEQGNQQAHVTYKKLGMNETGYVVFERS